MIFERLTEEIRFLVEGEPAADDDYITVSGPGGKPVKVPKSKVKKVAAGPKIPDLLRHGGKVSDQRAVSSGGRWRRRAKMAEEIAAIRIEARGEEKRRRQSLGMEKGVGVFGRETYRSGPKEVHGTVSLVKRGREAHGKTGGRKRFLKGREDVKRARLLTRLDQQEPRSPAHHRRVDWQVTRKVD